jgi:hypothetical protein
MHRGLTPAGKQYLGAVATDRTTQLQVAEACVSVLHLCFFAYTDRSVSMQSTATCKLASASWQLLLISRDCSQHVAVAQALDSGSTPCDIDFIVVFTFCTVLPAASLLAGSNAS